MAQQRMKARDKKVQKMTRNGLIEENLSQKSTVRVSSRASDIRMERKNHLGKDEKAVNRRSTPQTRADPSVQGKRKQNKKLHTSDKDAGAKDLIQNRSETVSEKNSGTKKNKKYQESQKKSANGKLQEKERVLTKSRGDSRKNETGGTKRPKQKKRLQFASEETGAGEQIKASGRTKTNAEKKSESKKKTYKSRYYTQDSNTGKQPVSKLKFEQDKKSGKNTGTKKNPTSAAAGAAASAVHRNISKYEDDNAAVKGVHHLEMGAERSGKIAASSVRSRNRRNAKRSRKLEMKKNKADAKALYRERVTKESKLHERSQIKKRIQKDRIKREYAKAKRKQQAFANAPKGSVDYIKKLGGKVTNFFKENRKVYLSIGGLIAMMFLIAVSLTSCATMFFQNAIDYTGLSYMSTDQAIRDADLYYTQLEANLEERINQIESDHTGYDRYRYQIDAIGHDPFVLISYLSAKHEVFEFNDAVKAELDELFAEQYSLSTQSSTETITEKKMVKVGESLGQVVTSAYCSCPICCGQWSGGPTASGVYPTANHTIAVDAYNPIVPMGTKVVMNGVEYTVEDTGGFAGYGVDFDVYYDSHSAAQAHGHQTWEAYLADDNGSREIEVTKTSTVSVFSVTLTNKSLTGICQNRLGTFDKELFSAYNTVKGNLQMFETPVDFNWYYRVSSNYGYRIGPTTGVKSIHNGLDIAADKGTPVAAGLTGTVSESAYNESYGNYVVIRDDKGYEIRYAHLNSRSVSAGQAIEKGKEIGKVGSTGDSTGPHLHLELLHNGERLNPIFYFETGEAIPEGTVEYSSNKAKRLVEFALQFQGTPYVWGGYSPSGFDCSGFVSYVLTNSGVLNTGHLDCNGLLARMRRIPESDLQPGDILFFQGTYATEGASHVGIYIGNGQMVHSGEPNQITNIYNPYYQQHWLCAARW